MAFITGTATDAADLWSKLLDFLQNNEDLVADGQNWDVAWEAPTGSPNETAIVLRGPGYTGTDNVYVGMQRVDRPTPDEYEIQTVGMTGFLAGATTIFEHANVSPQPVRMFIDSHAMTYWMVANGRRFVVVAKISTVFESMYAGLFLPYGDPTQYSYPLFIGGSAGIRPNADAISSWRSTAEGHRHFMHAYENVFNPNAETSAWTLSPQGEWLRTVSTGTQGPVAVGPRRFHAGLDNAENTGSGRWGYRTINDRLRAGFDGSMLLTPHTLVQSIPANQTYGVLHGTFHVPGFGNSAENIVTMDGVDHLVVQDVFRTGVGEFWALALE